MAKSDKSLRYPVPDGLGPSGRTLWVETVTLYELRPDELPVLEYACNTRDMIDTLRQSWEADGRPMTARGSTGQLVIHPLIGEIRVQQLTYEKLRSALKLPELDAGAETNQNRDAANASWQPGVRGRGA